MKKFAVVISILTLVCAPVVAKGGGGHSSCSNSGSSSIHSSTGGSHSVKGYVKKDGTRVAPSHATNQNQTKYDNWSTKGNANPYTGKESTKDPVT